MGRRATSARGGPTILKWAFAVLVVALAIYVLSMAWTLIDASDRGCGQHISVKVPGAAVETTTGGTCGNESLDHQSQVRDKTSRFVKH
jgi:hypothetical protein